MNFKLLHALAISAALFAPTRLYSAENGVSGKTFGIKVFAEGFVSPTTLVPLPDSDGAMLVADQVGVIYRVDKEGKVAETPFLDLRPRMTKLNKGFDERGLLSLALHPKYAENKKFYVTYSAPRRPTAPEDWDNTMRLAEFTANSDGLTGNDESYRSVLEVDKPYFNHNGGCLQFGPDGFLYMSAGDGGNGSDQGKRPPQGNGQNLNALLGKILRIDIDNGKPYGIPKDNPFVGKSARPEIFAYGLRNPWRISFDSGGDHQLFAADVGQDGFEEVDIIVKGGNYGWKVREGFHCFDPRDTIHPPEECPTKGANGDPFIDPIFEYKNFKAHPKDPDAQGVSITGGFVYRGKAMPWLDGQYVFADWSRVFVKPDGVLFTAEKGTDGKWSWRRIIPSTHPSGTKFFITGFGQDADQELYIFTNESNGLVGTTGKVQKLVPM